MKTEERIIKVLNNNKKNLGIAESCTGGLIGSKLTSVPGSSQCFRLGIIAYSNAAKTALLKVPASFIKKYGAVSEEVALAMAKGIRTIHATDYSLSISGIAGPTGGTIAKPVGLVYIAVATEQERLCLHCQFEGSRNQIRMKAANQALKLLEEYLK